MNEDTLRPFRQIIERLSDDAVGELLDHLAAEPRLFTRDGARLLVATAIERELPVTWCEQCLTSTHEPVNLVLFNADEKPLLHDRCVGDWLVAHRRTSTDLAGDVSTAEPGTLVVEIDFNDPVDQRDVTETAAWLGRHWRGDVTAARVKVKGAPDWQARAEA